MIITRRIRHRGAWVTLAMAGLLLQGCEGKPPEAAATGPRLFAADMTGGAKSCQVPKVSPISGKPVTAAMTVGNDGGWCGMTVAQAKGEPFDAGLLNQAPDHGKVQIHKVGDKTRIDYTPDPNFTGTDTFAVTLLPGDAVIRTTVTVVARK
jgi:Bacterial Ig domain